MRSQPVTARRRLESGYAVALVLVLTDLSPLSAARFSPLEVNVYAVLQLLAYAVAMALLVCRLPSSVRAARRDLLLWAATIVAVASVFWSIAPETSLRAAAKLIGTSAAGIYLASAFRPAEQLALVWKALGIAAIASLAFVLSSPEGTHSDNLAPAWKGIFHHRNHFGRLMVLSAVASCLVVLRSRERASVRRWSALVTLGLSMYLVFRTDSASALVLSIAILPPLVVYSSLRRVWSPRTSLACVAFAVAVGAVLTALRWESLLAALDRSPTLTGRTSLWKALLPIVEERPWLGYGYKAFWMNMEGPYRELYERLLWHIWHAHNGYLDLMLDVGAVGATLYLLSLGLALLRSLRLLVSSHDEMLWPLALLIFLGSYSMVEGEMLLTFNVYSLLYVATALSLRRPPPTASS